MNRNSEIIEATDWHFYCEIDKNTFQFGEAQTFYC